MTGAGRAWRLIPFLGLAVMGCSAGLQAISTPSEPTAPVVYTPTALATIESSGRILAFQDVNFRLPIPGAGGTATSALVNGPSWASIDSAAGEVVGRPGEAQSIPDFQILVTDGGVTTTLGPYSLEVIADPLKTHQWHLENTGQSAFAGIGGTPGEDIHLSDTISRLIFGKGVRIAISDTGIQESHPHLKPNLIPGASRNYAQNYSATKTWTGNSSPSVASATNAHGTAVAGIAAERGWMGTGGRGVAPLAGLAGFHFIPAQELLSRRGLLFTALYDQFAGDFDIFNYSWGDPQCQLLEYPDDLRDKMKAGATGLRGGKGALYVKAAGNDYQGYLADCYPSLGDDGLFVGNANFSEDATSPYTINVGALNAKGSVSSYSSPGSNLWISAPGGEYGWSKPASIPTPYRDPAILTTDFQGCSYGIKSKSRTRNIFDAGSPPNRSCRHTSSMNGTSSASPVTAGAIALLLSARPDLTWRDVKHILASTADQVHASSGPSPHPAGENLPGHTYELGWVTNSANYKFHNWYGFGRVNVDAAVALAKTYVSALGPFRETNVGNTWTIDSGPLDLSVTGGSAAGRTQTLNVADAITVEAVQVRVSAKDCIGQLGIELISPSETRSILMNINSGLLDEEMISHIFLSNAFYGENGTGDWTLKLVGGKTGCDAAWKSWQINILGH